MDSIVIVQGRGQCRAIVNEVTNLRVSYNARGGGSSVASQLAASREGLSSMS
jgi:hypothetical protein